MERSLSAAISVARGSRMIIHAVVVPVMAYGTRRTGDDAAAIDGGNCNVVAA
jgi:hypothetical protein